MPFFESFNGIAVEHHSDKICHIRRVTPGPLRQSRAATTRADIAVLIDGTPYRIDSDTGLNYATPASVVQAHRYDPVTRLGVTLAGNRVTRLEWLPRHSWPADMPVAPVATVALSIDGSAWAMAHDVTLADSGFD